MMDKKNNPQLELFMQTEKETRATDGIRSFSLLAQMKNHEKPIILAILFITTGIVCFSLGVKKGKAIGLKKTASMINLASRKSSRRSQVTTSDDLTRKNAGVTKKASLTTKKPAIKQADLSVSENYAIQVASFRTRKNAEKEASFLNKRGFSTLIRKKGDYAVVYVGKFPDRKKANSVLNELRKKYSDCVMRRM